jgi:transcriptional regulator of arginine metabolism
MKEVRRQKILELVREGTIHTQADLVARLRALGMPVTQATVSRDIRELGLVKVASGDGRLRYAAPPGSDRRPELELLADCLIDVEASGNLLVLRTMRQTAALVAESVEALGWSEVLACVPVERTVLVVLREGAEASAVARRLRRVSR